MTRRDPPGPRPERIGRAAVPSDLARRVLLTGRPGCGKTTVIRRTVELLGPSGCAGFYTEEVRQRGRRVGFDVVTLDGKRGALARVGATRPRVGRYGVDLASFERLGVSALETGLEDRAPVLVVDEIGKMELFSSRFVETLGHVFDPAATHAVLGTLMLGRNRHVDELRRRPDIRVVSVTAENRDRLPSELIAELGGPIG